MSTLYQVACVSDQIFVPTEEAQTSTYAVALFWEMIDFIRAYTGLRPVKINGTNSAIFNDGTTVQIFRIS